MTGTEFDLFLIFIPISQVFCFVGGIVYARRKR